MSSIYRSGTAKMMVVSDRGKEATIGVIQPGEYCGEGCLIEEPARLQTVMSMTACSMLRMPKKAFLRLLRDHAEFSSLFTSIPAETVGQDSAGTGEPAIPFE